VDARLAAEAPILARALDATQALGLRWTIERRDAPERENADALVRLRFERHDAPYIVEVKRGLRVEHLGPLLHRFAGRHDLLLVADYVNPPLAEALRRHGIQFIDTAGNAHLMHPPLFVFVQGRRRPRDPLDAAREPKGRAFQATGLQVLFALLCEPGLVTRPYREIAARANVAHGTVGWVMPELPRLGFVAEIGGVRRLTNGERLLAQWVEAYARTLRPRLLFGRYRLEPAELPPDFDAARYGFFLGGEPAAARLTGFLRPGTFTFYGPPPEARLLADLRLRHDPEGNVDFRRRFWNFGEATGLVPPLLVYADLLAIGDARCLETAKLVHERHLARLL
jgi:hypothetical protein